MLSVVSFLLTLIKYKLIKNNNKLIVDNKNKVFKVSSRLIEKQT